MSKWRSLGRAMTGIAEGVHGAVGVMTNLQRQEEEQRRHDERLEIQRAQLKEQSYANALDLVQSGMSEEQVWERHIEQMPWIEDATQSEQEKVRRQFGEWFNQQQLERVETGTRAIGEAFAKVDSPEDMAIAQATVGEARRKQADLVTPGVRKTLAEMEARQITAARNRIQADDTLTAAQKQEAIREATDRISGVEGVGLSAIGSAYREQEHLISSEEVRATALLNELDVTRVEKLLDAEFLKNYIYIEGSGHLPRWRVEGILQNPNLTTAQKHHGISLIPPGQNLYISTALAVAIGLENGLEQLPPEVQASLSGGSLRPGRDLAPGAPQYDLGGGGAGTGGYQTGAQVPPVQPMSPVDPVSSGQTDASVDYITQIEQSGAIDRVTEVLWGSGTAGGVSGAGVQAAFIEGMKYFSRGEFINLKDEEGETVTPAVFEKYLDGDIPIQAIVGGGEGSLQARLMLDEESMYQVREAASFLVYEQLVIARNVATQRLGSMADGMEVYNRLLARFDDRMRAAIDRRDAEAQGAAQKKESRVGQARLGLGDDPPEIPVGIVTGGPLVEGQGFFDPSQYQVHDTTTVQAQMPTDEEFAMYNREQPTQAQYGQEQLDLLRAWRGTGSVADPSRPSAEEALQSFVDFPGAGGTVGYVPGVGRQPERRVVTPVPGQEPAWYAPPGKAYYTGVLPEGGGEGAPLITKEGVSEIVDWLVGRVRESPENALAFLRSYLEPKVREVQQAADKAPSVTYNFDRGWDLGYSPDTTTSMLQAIVRIVGGVASEIGTAAVESGREVGARYGEKGGALQDYISTTLGKVRKIISGYADPATAPRGEVTTTEKYKPELPVGEQHYQSIVRRHSSRLIDTMRDDPNGVAMMDQLFPGSEQEQANQVFQFIAANFGVESSWNPNAESSEGASGLAQITRANLEHWGNLLGIDAVSARFDPELSVQIGSEMLIKSLVKINGEVPPNTPNRREEVLGLVLGIYNYGRQNIRNLYRDRINPDDYATRPIYEVWQSVLRGGLLNAETSGHIVKVLDDFRDRMGGSK